MWGPARQQGRSRGAFSSRSRQRARAPAVRALGVEARREGIATWWKFAVARLLSALAMARFYVTTPIYYINDIPHLGTAYTTILADVLARFHRLRGDETWALTGTDEHGLKIERAAAEKGLRPEVFADAAALPFRETWPKLGCAFDDFIRTTEPRHVRGVQELWRRVRDAGELYRGTYEGLYCVRCEAYYVERDLLPGGLCPTHRAPAERLSEPSYFFPLSRYRDRLLAFYASRPDFVLPEGRMNEVMRFVEGGLEDISVSRTTFRWGVPVPDDPDHVMYVWFDALGNYWSALQEPERRGHFWPPAVHLVGKDILRFHAVYWPAFLMAAGFTDAELPRHVFAHGWLTVNGEKMSKTLRNAVTPAHLLGAFEGILAGKLEPELARAVGADTLRYYLTRAVALGQDGDFNLRDLMQRYNSELGNALGNLAQRVLAQSERHHGGRVPAFDAAAAGPAERALAAAFEEAARASVGHLEALQPQRAVDAVWKAVDAANRYIDTTAPWALAKAGRMAELDLCLGTALSALSALSVWLWPFIPSVAGELRAQLGLSPLEPELGVDAWPEGLVQRAPGEPLGQRRVLFPRLDAAEERAFSVAVLGEGASAERAGAPAAASAGASPAVTAATEGAAAVLDFDDFLKVELRAGLVLSCERVPKKDKLLRLSVDLGEAEPRQIVAGLALSFTPEQLTGRRVLIVANLAPRSFGGGLVSQGMVLAAGENPNLRLPTVPDDVAPGTRLK